MFINLDQVTLYNIIVSVNRKWNIYLNHQSKLDIRMEIGTLQFDTWHTIGDCEQHIQPRADTVQAKSHHIVGVTSWILMFVTSQCEI